MQAGTGGMWRCRKSPTGRRYGTHGRATRRRGKISISPTETEQLSNKENTMTLRIGANPIGWSNDDMRELGGDTPLETCLAEAGQVGFEGMELGHKFPRGPGA